MGQSCRHPFACDEEALSDWWHLRSRDLRHTHSSIFGGRRAADKLKKGRRLVGERHLPSKPVGVWGSDGQPQERMKRATIPDRPAGGWKIRFCKPGHKRQRNSWARKARVVAFHVLPLNVPAPALLRLEPEPRSCRPGTAEALRKDRRRPQGVCSLRGYPLRGGPLRGGPLRGRPLRGRT